MTAKELIAHLKKLPPDTQILVSGYEGGYKDATAPLIENRSIVKRDVNTEWYYGSHELEDPKGEEFPDSAYGVVI